MKYHKRFVLMLLLSVCCINIDAQATFDGLWTGKISAGGIEVQLDLDVRETDNKALLSVPIQGLKDIVSSSLDIKGDTIKITFSMFQARYDGIYDMNSGQIIGTWYQGRETAVNFTRAEGKTELKRPQTPEGPFPYDIEEVKIVNIAADVVLAGTLTTPKGEGPFPLAITISGSGRQNRDSDILGHKSFLIIADYLTRAGIAVLRYDDRGVEESSGNHRAATTEDLASDAKAVAEYAIKLSKIDPQRVGFIGHSEGGMIASLVASQLSDIGFIVSLAGPGVPISDLMTNQNVQILKSSGMSEEGLAITKENLPIIYSIVNQDVEPRLIFDTLNKSVHHYYDLLTENDQKLLAPNKASYYMQLSQSFFSPWFKYFLAYDPTESWQSITCPVLALNGSRDIQVDAVTNISAIKNNLTIGGNMNVNTEIIDGLNHLFQPCNKCNLSEYATIETTFEPAVLEKIKSFILGL